MLKSQVICRSNDESKYIATNIVEFKLHGPIVQLVEHWRTMSGVASLNPARVGYFLVLSLSISSKSCCLHKTNIVNSQPVCDTSRGVYPLQIIIDSNKGALLSSESPLEITPSYETGIWES